MTNVICPKCHSVVPLLRSCLNCYMSLGSGDEHAGESAASFSASPSGTTDAAPFGVIGSMASQIDPNLFKWIQRREQGFRKLQSTSQAEDQLGVIARVTEVKALEAIPGVKIATRVKPTPGEEETPTWIVTALIPLGMIEQIRRQDFVVSLKASQRIRPSLETTVREIRAENSDPPGQPFAEGGRNVIVGIVDFGMDFMHRNFRLPGVDGASRILALWDQMAPASDDSPSPFGYGRVHTKEKIDAALQEQDPYEFLGYGPPPDSLFVTGAHGTYVADVAAGNGEGSGARGVAPNADIVFVEIATTGVPFSKDDVVGNTFGDAKQLLDAVKFIFDFATAREQPCVINLSLGTNGGSHDGRTLIEMAMDRLVKEAPNRAVVIAASNLAGKKLHVSGKVSPDPNEPTEIKWRIFANDTTINELEIWYSKNDRFDVEVVKPNGITKINVEFGEKASFSVGEKSTMVVVNRKNGPNDEDNTINAFFEREIAPGTWTLRLRAASLSPDGGGFHAWIERDETGQSRFETSDIDDECTLGSIACGEKSIVVGAYDAHDPLLKPCDSSGRGPTRIGRQKPEVSAPGQDVLAAYSRTVVQRHKESGTSMAAPAVTGVVALMLATAMDAGISLDIDTIRNILIDKARPNPPMVVDAPTDKKWDSQYGYGRVSASAAVAAVLELVGRNVVPEGTASRGADPITGD